MASTFAFAESRGGELASVAARGGDGGARGSPTPRAAARCTRWWSAHRASRRSAAMLGQYGADVVTAVEHPALERYSPEVYAATAAARIEAGDYRAVFFAASAAGTRPRRRASRRRSTEPGV